MATAAIAVCSMTGKILQLSFALCSIKSGLPLKGMHCFILLKTTFYLITFAIFLCQHLKYILGEGSFY